VSAPAGEDVVADPVGLIVRLVAEADPAMSLAGIRSEVTRVAGGRAKRRRLAQAVRDDPSLLTAGGPPVPWAAGQLLLGLRAAGSQVIAAPRCGECGRGVSYLISRQGQVICSPCRDKPQVCARCGEERRVSTRDRRGRPRCDRCPDTDGDPIRVLAEVVADVDPAIGSDLVTAALGRAIVRPAGQRRLAWAIADQPALLAGDGSRAPSPAVLRFIDELIRAGATRIRPPRCPRCDRAVSLSKLLDGQRVCRACFARTKAVPCCRCGSVREPAARDADGGPLCPNCLVSDPANLEDCARCGKRRRVAVRTADGPLYQGCRHRPVLACSICGRAKPCEISRATGEPWCDSCQNRWRRCSACGTMAPVHGGAPGRPLCARCVNPDPVFWDRCPECRETWVLSLRPCQRCVLGQHVRQLLENETGEIRPDLAPLLKALTEAERPDNAIAWLRQPRVREILSAIGRQSRAVTHEALDEMPPGKTLAHLRSILVATGTLPERDERLIRLEHWVREAIGRREDPGERRVLRSYATWHHLRKLRNRLRGAPVTRLQDLNVRCHVTAAANFLDWLAGQGLTLDACRQGDLDRRNSTETSYPAETAHFIRWAVKHRYARDLTAGAIRWSGPKGPHDTEKRWDDARRLLHDDTPAIQDRVAGLLLLLYAQRIAAITKLTTDDVRDDGASVTISFGTAPVVLPPPLHKLVRELAASRRGHAAIGRPAVTPWLFAGGRPGQPITDDALGDRLKKIGLNPLRDRSTALFSLASEVPAAILARMLGIHVTVAVQWQRAAAGDWMAYAADISRRNITPEPGTQPMTLRTLSRRPGTLGTDKPDDWAAA
jgi:hypothetical protein